MKLYKKLLALCIILLLAMAAAAFAAPIDRTLYYTGTDEETMEPLLLCTNLADGQEKLVHRGKSYLLESFDGPIAAIQTEDGNWDIVSLTPEGPSETLREDALGPDVLRLLAWNNGRLTLARKTETCCEIVTIDEHGTETRPSGPTECLCWLDENSVCMYTTRVSPSGEVVYLTEETTEVAENILWDTVTGLHCSMLASPITDPEKSTVTVYDSESGTAEYEVSARRLQNCAPVWLNDEAFIYWTDNALTYYNVNDGSVQLLWDDEGRPITGPGAGSGYGMCVDPAGEYIAYATPDDLYGDVLAVTSLSDGSTRIFTGRSPFGFLSGDAQSPNISVFGFTDCIMAWGPSD